MNRRTFVSITPSTLFFPQSDCGDQVTPVSCVVFSGKLSEFPVHLSSDKNLVHLYRMILHIWRHSFSAQKNPNCTSWGISRRLETFCEFLSVHLTFLCSLSPTFMCKLKVLALVIWTPFHSEILLSGHFYYLFFFFSSCSKLSSPIAPENACQRKVSRIVFCKLSLSLSLWKVLYFYPTVQHPAAWILGEADERGALFLK